LLVLLRAFKSQGRERFHIDGRSRSNAPVAKATVVAPWKWANFALAFVARMARTGTLTLSGLVTVPNKLYSAIGGTAPSMHLTHWRQGYAGVQLLRLQHRGEPR
jgi:hypothetical protein